jgi:hypothetical protein
MTGWKMVFCDGPVAVGAVAADAPPATTNEIPAPRTGKLVFMRFRLEGCFACGMVTPLGEDALHVGDVSTSSFALPVNRCLILPQMGGAGKVIVFL